MGVLAFNYGSSLVELVAVAVKGVLVPIFYRLSQSRGGFPDTTHSFTPKEHL